MRNIGYVLIVASFLAGSYFAVEKVEGVPVLAFVISLGIGVVGVTLVRVAIARAASHEETLSANIGVIDSSLASLVAKIDDLVERKDSIDVYDLRTIIDREFPNDLDAFVAARESIGHRFGLQSYANVMNPFSVGERYLNRVWSTSTDGYIDEAHRSMISSRDHFREALDVFRALTT